MSIETFIEAANRAFESGDVIAAPFATGRMIGETYVGCPIGAACFGQPFSSIRQAMELAALRFDTSHDFLEGVIVGFDYGEPLDATRYCGDKLLGHRVGCEMHERWVK